MADNQTLQQRLQVKDGKIVLTQDLSPNLTDFLSSYYNGEAIVIAAATVESLDDEGKSIVISGMSGFLNMADLPLTATLSLDGNGNLVAQFKYGLREDAAPAANAWTFSRSFTDLPVVLNLDTPAPTTLDENYNILNGQTPFVDSLYLYDSYVIVATGAMSETQFNVSLKKGLNFVSKLKPLGNLIPLGTVAP